MISSFSFNCIIPRVFLIVFSFVLIFTTPVFLFANYLYFYSITTLSIFIFLPFQISSPFIILIFPLYFLFIVRRDFFLHASCSTFLYLCRNTISNLLHSLPVHFHTNLFLFIYVHRNMQFIAYDQSQSKI